LILFTSEGEATKPYLFLPLAFLVLPESKCLLQALPNKTLPVQVILTLF
jgi:hypothetical protein